MPLQNNCGEEAQNFKSVEFKYLLMSFHLIDHILTTKIELNYFHFWCPLSSPQKTYIVFVPLPASLTVWAFTVQFGMMQCVPVSLRSCTLRILCLSSEHTQSSFAGLELQMVLSQLLGLSAFHVTLDDLWKCLQAVESLAGMLYCFNLDLSNRISIL